MREAIEFMEDIDHDMALPACSLALHYLVPEGKTAAQDSLKALVLIGSICEYSNLPVFLADGTATVSCFQGIIRSCGIYYC